MGLFQHPGGRKPGLLGAGILIFLGIALGLADTPDQVQVGGKPAAAVVTALRNAGVRSSAPGATRFKFSEVACSMGSEAKSPAQSSGAQCKLTSPDGSKSLTLLGLDAGRIQLAIEATGAHSDVGMQKRGIDVADLSAELPPGGASSASLSYTDQNAQNRGTQ